MSFKEEDIPAEVKWVWAQEIAGNPVGMEIFTKVQEIRKQYPQWFAEKDLKNIWKSFKRLHRQIDYSQVPEHLKQALRRTVNTGLLQCNLRLPDDWDGEQEMMRQDNSQ